MISPPQVEITPQTHWLQRAIIEHRFVLKKLMALSLLLMFMVTVPYFLWVDLVRHSFRAGIIQNGHYYMIRPASELKIEVRPFEYYALLLAQASMFVFGSGIVVSGVCSDFLKKWGYDDFGL